MATQALNVQMTRNLMIYVYAQPFKIITPTKLNIDD